MAEVALGGGSLPPARAAGRQRSAAGEELSAVAEALIHTIADTHRIMLMANCCSLVSLHVLDLNTLLLYTYMYSDWVPQSLHFKTSVFIKRGSQRETDREWRRG